MKLTSEPTESQAGKKPECMQPTVTVSIPDDNLDIHEFAELVRKLLLGCGYHQDNVRQVLGEE